MEGSSNKLLELAERGGNGIKISMKIPNRGNTFKRKTLMHRNSSSEISLDSILRRSISESVEKNVCRRVTIHAVSTKLYYKKCALTSRQN